MNKKGALVLRDIIFMLIIFSGILVLSSLIVNNMAGEYSNTNMSTEYYANNSIGHLGDEGLANITSSIKIMTNETGSSIGVWDFVTGSIGGLKTVLVTVLESPIYVGTALTKIMTALRIPSEIIYPVSNIVIYLIYGVVIFVIVSAFLRGGKV